MSMPARMRESASMAGMAAAPPAEWPAIAIRDGSISAAPGHAGCAPVSSPSTKETSAARPATTFSALPDRNGKAVFASDEQVDPLTVKLIPGAEFHRLWRADQAPA